MNKRLYTILISFAMLPIIGSHMSTASAQCPVENKAIQGGERLDYKLYFNWKFIWKTAGSATLTTKDTTYKGQPVYQTDLITRTSGRIDKWFSMRDTLRSVYTKNIVPLYYRKGANEGGKYRCNDITFTYHGGQSHLHQYYHHGDGRISVADNHTAECAFDMISMMMRARSFSASDFTVGKRVPFKLADGDKIKTETLVYRGIKNFTTEGEKKVTYRCLVFSYIEKVKKKEKEVITFYITDDDNHIPVRLDMNLRFGVAKAYLKTATGLRNPESSIVKD